MWVRLVTKSSLSPTNTTPFSEMGYDFKQSLNLLSCTYLMQNTLYRHQKSYCMDRLHTCSRARWPNGVWGEPAYDNQGECIMFHQFLYLCASFAASDRNIDKLIQKCNPLYGATPVSQISYLHMGHRLFKMDLFKPPPWPSHNSSYTRCSAFIGSSFKTFTRFEEFLINQ